MVAKNQLKTIKSLHQKKYRDRHGLFFVEGGKSVNELLQANFRPKIVLVTKARAAQVRTTGAIEEILERDLEKISALKTPNGILGVFHIPKPVEIDGNGWVVALDTVQDPGNLGTIIRACDWFGVRHLACSKGTVDCYNPKVLQATMGAIARVAVHYLDLERFLKTAGMPVYGAFMDGAPVNEKKLPAHGILVLGNEANGISTAVAECVGQRIAIPQFGGKTAESLNVALAAGILLNEVRRKTASRPL